MWKNDNSSKLSRFIGKSETIAASNKIILGNGRGKIAKDFLEKSKLWEKLLSLEEVYKINIWWLWEAIFLGAKK